MYSRPHQKLSLASPLFRVMCAPCHVYTGYTSIYLTCLGPNVNHLSSSNWSVPEGRDRVDSAKDRSERVGTVVGRGNDDDEALASRSVAQTFDMLMNLGEHSEARRRSSLSHIHPTRTGEFVPQTALSIVRRDFFYLYRAANNVLPIAAPEFHQ